MRVILFFRRPRPPAKAPPDIDDLLKTGHAAYRKADYAEARKSFEAAWSAAAELPDSDPSRYEILKNLSGVLGASGAKRGSAKLYRTGHRLARERCQVEKTVRSPTI